MSRRSYHARSEQALIDVDIDNDGTNVSAKVFIKILDESILDRPAGFTANYLVQFPNAAVNEYVEDIRTDPRFNAASKTLFASYVWPTAGIGSQWSQIMLGYWRTDQAESANNIGFIGEISAS
jgi:hypothetical protein